MTSVGNVVVRGDLVPVSQTSFTPDNIHSGGALNEVIFINTEKMLCNAHSVFIHK